MRLKPANTLRSRERNCRGLWSGVLLVLTLATAPAVAWNGVGHRAVAELVWRQFDSAQRQVVSDLLQQHPHYKEMLLADRPRQVHADEWVFLSAAAWPDWVRPAKGGQRPKPESVTKYNVYPHGVELPFVRPGDSTEELLKQYPAVEQTAQIALTDSLATVQNANASGHDRAVSLCWVLHLLADLHQPLHCANLVTPERIRDLSAGGGFLVRQGGKEPLSLHAFWDQLPGLDSSPSGVTALADKLARAPELRPAALPELQTNQTIVSWIRESHQLAADFAYAADRVEFASAGDVESGKLPPAAIPVVASNYLAEARIIAHRRLALAAWRLVGELKDIGTAPLKRERTAAAVP